GKWMDGRRQHGLSTVGNQITDPLAVDIPRARRRDIRAVVKPRLTLLSDLLNRRLRQHLGDRYFDPRVVGIDVHTDQAMRGASADDADAGVALTPGGEIFSAR